MLGGRLGYGCGVTEQELAAPGRTGGFRVHLEVFEGPFDLLLGLIAKHKLDITEVALSQVTDEFIAHIRSYGAEWDLGQATEFLVVAATLLDLKAARLLPAGQVEDEDDLALLEARDLLFARLLQYRAYKQVAAVFSARMADEARRHPRAVMLEPVFANLLPELVFGLGAAEFAVIAARALAPKEPPSVPIAHLHPPLVSVREQAAVLVERLRRVRTTTFRALSADAGGTLVVVARFLALLELYREGAVAFDQLEPYADLQVRWTGTEDGGIELTDEFDVDEAAAEGEANDSPVDGAGAGVPPAEGGDAGARPARRAGE